MAYYGKGSQGQVLFDQTSPNMSKFTTPTYPSASGTSRKILVSDGTDNIYSTETWAVPGASGNVLTSDGTNWLSSAPSGGGILTESGTLTNSQIKALHGTPVQAIAAPGSGKVIQVLSVAGKLNYGGTSAFTAGASQKIESYYGTATSIATIMPNTGIVSTANTINLNSASVASVNSQPYSNFANTVVNLYNSVATEITGNAANDNTIAWSITYQILTI